MIPASVTAAHPPELNELPEPNSDIPALDSELFTRYVHLVLKNHLSQLLLFQ